MDLHEGMKSNQNGKHVGKYKRIFKFVNLFKRYLIIQSKQIIKMYCGVSNTWRSKMYDNNGAKLGWESYLKVIALYMRWYSINS